MKSVWFYCRAVDNCLFPVCSSLSSSSWAPVLISHSVPLQPAQSSAKCANSLRYPWCGLCLCWSIKSHAFVFVVKNKQINKQQKMTAAKDLFHFHSTLKNFLSLWSVPPQINVATSNFFHLRFSVHYLLHTPQLSHQLFFWGGKEEQVWRDPLFYKDAFLFYRLRPNTMKHMKKRKGSTGVTTSTHLRNSNKENTGRPSRSEELSAFLTKPFEF